MSEIMSKIANPRVSKVFNNYPFTARKHLLMLRQLILDVVAEIPSIDLVEETLKWGEPAYLVKDGSTIRIDWKPSDPEHYVMYFNCNTRLIETFRELYRDQFTFIGKRAIVFNVTDKLAIKELKHCIFLALTYHKRKHLPLLGI